MTADIVIASHNDTCSPRMIEQHCNVLHHPLRSGVMVAEAKFIDLNQRIQNKNIGIAVNEIMRRQGPFRQPQQASGETISRPYWRPVTG